MREGNQSDKIDARRLAELLRLNHLNPVYHAEHGLRDLFCDRNVLAFPDKRVLIPPSI
jgi:hypothetical protein